MKKILLSLVAAVTLSLSSFGQAPEGFKYQAVVRDAGNTILNNQAVGMRMTIQQGSIGGTTVYSETFAPTTNMYGLVNLEIGNGTVVSGTFANIDWSAGPYFMETAVDVTGGTNYAVMGTSQLMSVPYALYAKTSGNGQGPAGPQGNQGPAGVDGTNGTNGTNGIDGVDGIDGADGQDGLSAYETWLAQGNTGTEAEFLTSLTGPQGTPGSQDAWGLTGNSGTNPSTNFIGTTDAQDVIVKTNGAERMRVMSNGNVGVGTNSPSELIEIEGSSLFRNDTTSIARALRIHNNNNASYIQVGPGDLQQSPTTLAVTGMYGSRLGLLSVFGDIYANEATYKIFGPPSITSYPLTSQGLLYGSRAYGASYPFQTSGNVILQTTTDLDRDIIMVTGSVPKERMVVKSNGRIGIGTADPLGKLHVNNDSAGLDSSFVISNSGLVGMGMTPTMRLDVWPSGTITDQQVMRVTGYVYDNPSSPPIAAIRGSADGASVFEISKPAGAARNFAQLRMGVDGTLGSIYSNGGNFGININNPARTLHVKDVMRLEPIPAAPTSPAKGDMYFDSILNKLRVYDGTTWQNCW